MTMIDVTEQINASRRRLGRRTLEAGEARTLTITQTYDAPVEDVWDACTNPERIPRWFLPVSGDLRLGGRYQLEGNAGGTVERCDPPKSFAATWEFGGMTSWIELRLFAEGDGATRFELDHISLVGDHWKEFGPGAVGIGWDLGLLGLSLHLASGGEPVDKEKVMAWTTSEEGVRFMRLSGDAWCEADIADGTDPDEARAAAGRTFAAYTTPPSEDT
jgi:uncharacterized protein YndB with AHSA1/START domain